MEVDNTLMELVWNGGRNSILARRDLSAIEVITGEKSSEVYHYSTDEALHVVLTAVRAVFDAAGHPGAWVGWSKGEGFADELSDDIAKPRRNRAQEPDNGMTPLFRMSKETS